MSVYCHTSLNYVTHSTHILNGTKTSSVRKYGLRVNFKSQQSDYKCLNKEKKNCECMLGTSLYPCVYAI